VDAGLAMLQLWFGISVTANIGLALAWFLTNRRLRRLENRPVAPPDVDDFANRVEQAIDGLARRVDELANGQDFLNRVLTDRLDKRARALPASESASTPR